jgi:predicted RNA-binding Zn ribbon-like protein
MVMHGKHRPEPVGTSASSVDDGHHLRLSLASPQTCLDFANTFGSRLASHPQEPFTSYHNVVAWCQQAGILTAPLAERLTQQAAHHAAQGHMALRQAIHLREAIYRLFSAAASKGVAEAADLAMLNRTLADALATMRVAGTGDGYTWTWGTEEVACDQVLWPLALSAANLLTAKELQIVRECAAADCSWLFLDMTRNRSRRWCDMKVCGNRAKARRHYARQKQAAIVYPSREMPYNQLSADSVPRQRTSSREAR